MIRIHDGYMPSLSVYDTQRAIDYIKRQIESCKETIARERKRK